MQPVEHSSLIRTELAAPTPSEQSFTWQPGSVSFASSNASPSTATYSGENVPPPGAETFDMNLWLFDGKPPRNGKETEVIIKRFSFTASA